MCLSHTIGRQFDKDGNTVNWWEKATDENYRKKAQCIIDQYSSYKTETGMNVRRRFLNTSWNSHIFQRMEFIYLLVYQLINHGITKELL